MVREGVRGGDQQQNHIFSYLSPEARVRKDHPLRAIEPGRGTYPALPAVRRDVCPGRPAVNCAREAVAGAVATDAVLDPQRTIADGRDGLQPCCSAGLWG
jgi:hypothetical protein